MPSDHNYTSHTFPTISFSYDKFGSVVNPSLTFPDNIGGAWPKTVTIGFRDNCGTDYTFNQTINLGSLGLHVSYQPVGTACDSVRYLFAVYHASNNERYFGGYTSPVTASQVQSNVFMNADVFYTIDSGASWHPVVASGHIEYGSVWLPRATANTLTVAYCGDMLSQTINTPALAQLGTRAAIVAGSNNGCSADIRLTYPAASSDAYPKGDSVTVEIISWPTSLASIPSPVTVSKGNTGVVFSDLPFGSYTFRITDSIGTECTRTYDHVFEIKQQPLNITLQESNYASCSGFTGIHIWKGSSSTTEGRPLVIEVLSQPDSSNIPTVFNYALPNSTANTCYNFPPELRNLKQGVYQFRITDSIGIDCPRTVTSTVNITNDAFYVNTDFTYQRDCNGALHINHTGRLRIKAENATNQQPAYRDFLKIKLLDATKAVVWSGQGAAVSGSNTQSTAIIPQSVMNALPDGTYTIRASKVTNTPLGNTDSCTVTEKEYIKQPVFIDLSKSRFIAGCSGDAAVASIAGVAEGGNAPYMWTLYRNAIEPDSLIAGPQASNIFTGLDANTTYYLRATDQCGVGNTRAMSVSEAAVPTYVSSNSGGAACPGDTITLSIDSIPGATYQWYKDGLPIPGATDYALVLENVDTPLDNGSYQVQFNLEGCLVLANEQNLNINCAVLSVSFGDFTARAEGNKSLLNWTTFNEENNLGFAVERSADGHNWNTIGFVNSQAENGNSDAKLNYVFYDNSPMTGKNFYRLKQEDINGTYEYSVVRMVRMEELAKAIFVSPNPVNDKLQVSGLTGQNTISVTNALGQEIIRVSNNNNPQQIIDMTQLVDGFYFITVRNENGTAVTFKVIKQ